MMVIESTMGKIVLVILAIIGLLTVIAILGMWLMHSSMMGGITHGMLTACSNMMATH
jgi:hypothetical protein